MRELKYIIIEIKNKSTEPKAIIFNGEIVHSLVLNPIMKEKYNIISAGYCTIELNGNIISYGYSASLNLKSRPEEDSKIIYNTLHNLHFS